MDRDIGVLLDIFPFLMQESVLACVQTTNHKLNITMTRTEQGVVHGVLKNTSRIKLTEFIFKKNLHSGKNSSYYWTMQHKTKENKLHNINKGLK